MIGEMPYTPTPLLPNLNLSAIRSLEDTTGKKKETSGIRLWLCPHKAVSGKKQNQTAKVFCKHGTELRNAKLNH